MLSLKATHVLLILGEMFLLNPSEARDLSASMTEGFPWEMCLSYVSGVWKSSGCGFGLGLIYSTKVPFKNSVEVLDMAMFCHQNVLDILSF